MLPAAKFWAGIAQMSLAQDRNALKFVAIFIKLETKHVR